MEDKNDWSTQEIKISCKHNRSLYAFTKNSNYPEPNVHYIKYCKILRKVIKETKKQHFSRLTAKSNNKNNMELYKERDRKSMFIGTCE